MVLKFSLIILYSLPAFYGVWFLTQGDFADPLAFSASLTGQMMLVLLALLLTMPLFTRFGVLKYRRLTGLTLFGYSLLHLVTYWWFELGFDPYELSYAMNTKPYIILGSVVFLVISFMTLTSTKKAFKRFRLYHRVIWLMLPLILLHYGWSLKVLGGVFIGWLVLFSGLSMMRVSKELKTP